MSAEPLRLDDLLESIADGSPLDWDALEASGDPGQQRLLRHLRVVARVAEVHRTVVLDEPADAVSDWPDGREMGQALPRWGHLILLEKIGEGAFGEVYRARDPWLDREVALKLMKPSVASPGSTPRIVNEARTLARVRHPNVVTVHGADKHDSRVGLWMDLVRGRTLAQIVAEQGPFSASEAAVTGQEVCRALAAVHAAGLVHRDIKAQNVMRESGGRLVLMDFGAGGTPLYLAPDVLAGGAATIQSDLYSLGVLLYYLATARYPVEAASLEDLQRAHASGERRRLAEQRPDLPDRFVAAVERALDSNPAARFQSALELQEALADVTSPALRPRALPLPAPRAARHVGRWTILAAVAIVVAALGAGLWRMNAVKDPGSDLQLIAVMPLLSEASDAGYFADGMTEALMQELSGVRSLRVVSRTSVDRARQSGGTLPDIARALQADAILEGSVSRTADAVRVNLRLIHAGNDTPVWSRSFEEPLRNVFALQRDVARSVAEELAVTVSSPSGEALQAIDPAAYDAYLRGRYELRRGSQVGVEAALKHFERAVAIDSRYARAHAAVAECYLVLGNDFGVLPTTESSRLAKEAAARALQLTEAPPDAYAAMANIKFRFDWDFAGAEEHFNRSVELDPSLVGPRQDYAMFLASRGRFDEALLQLSAARAVDPLSTSVADTHAFVYYFARRYDQALIEVERAIQLDANGMSAQVGRGRILNAMGRHQDAIAQYERAAKESASDHPFFQSEIAQAESAIGLEPRARARIQALESRASDPSSRVSPILLALAYARLDRDAAFAWLEREFQAKSGRVLWLNVDPRADPLRSDPRFASFLRRLQLVP